MLDAAEALLGEEGMTGLLGNGLALAAAAMGGHVGTVRMLLRRAEERGGALTRGAVADAAMVARERGHPRLAAQLERAAARLRQG